MSWKVILTHLAAVAVGWACVDLISVKNESNAGTGGFSLKTKSGVRSPGAKSNAEDEGPLTRWMGNTPDPALVERLKHESVAEVADGLIGKWGIESPMQIVLLQQSRDPASIISLSAEVRDLLLADPKGMRDWFEGLPSEKKQSLELLLMDERLCSAIPSDDLDSWQKVGIRVRWITLEKGRRAGRAGDSAYLESILTRSQGGAAVTNVEADAALNEVISNWPLDRVDQLLLRLHREPLLSGGEFGRLYERLPANKRQAFMDSVSSMAIVRLENDPMVSLRQIAAKTGVGMNLDERLRIVSPAFGGDVERFVPYLIGNDITRLFSGDGLPDGDSLQASLQKVRSGGINADELLGEVTARLGKLAEGREDLVKEKVFQQIAKIAPDAAVALLEGISAKTVQDKALSLGFDPAGFEAAASILRAREPEVPNDLHSRFSGWGHKSFEGLARYGDAYVSWALSMPRSLERDLVLSAIAIHLEKEDPDRAARLRTQKTYQSGWKPGVK